MKYIIVAKNIYEGNSTHDVANPLAVTEICSELIITRLYLIDLLKRGEISIDDTVVTADDRMCMYTKIFKNVITYKVFCEIEKTPEDSTIDLLEANLFDKLAIGGLIPYKPFYQNYERDKSEIDNIDWADLSEYKVDMPFVCLVIRKRGAWPEKNMRDNFWIELIKKFKSANTQVFIFGKETESFADGESVQYVKDYRDWCSIVRHNNCKHIASTMTGGVYPCLIFGNSGAEMTLIDNIRLMSNILNSENPSFYHECINFSKIKIEFINEIPTIEDFYGKISKNL